ncbi:hypothetical protein BLNAU_11086 [Blattamonas nauphoetae]|uniref:Uncharacterized protein n=1 Tax=Blattamonas nauphoetae TaxID=2049346 RepID=A0ABQ9XQW7_9EUKA|nr:hypothetical protein BLNAU_11086 [Blattamonas nauphoetae]
MSLCTTDKLTNRDQIEKQIENGANLVFSIPAHHPHPPTPLCLSLTTLPLTSPLPHHPHHPTPLCLSLTTRTLPLPSASPSPPTPSHSPLPLPHHPHPPTPLCLSLTTLTIPLPLPLPHHPHPPTPLCLSLTTHTFPLHSASPSPPSHSPLLSLTTRTLPLPSASPSPPTPSHSPLPLPHHPHPPTPLCLSLTTHILPLPSASPSPLSMSLLASTLFLLRSFSLVIEFFTHPSSLHSSPSAPTALEGTTRLLLADLSGSNPSEQGRVLNDQQNTNTADLLAADSGRLDPKTTQLSRSLDLNSDRLLTNDSRADQRLTRTLSSTLDTHS